MTKSFLSLLLVLSAAAACGDDGEDGTSPTSDAMPGAPDSAVGPDAMPGTGPDAMTSGIAFMEPCDIANDQCAGELLCFSFNNKGPHCTHACDIDADCESPSTGCSGMNVCKVP